MSVKAVIKDLEKDIEEMSMDLNYVHNMVSVRELKNAIRNREDRIKELREKYLNS